VKAKKVVEAVRVEPLAVLLGVTGSFYWHFANRRALLDAMLAQWEQRSTEAVIEGVNSAAGRPAERLAHLATLIGRRKKLPPMEQGIRAWGAVDQKARRALARVDARRIDYVLALLQ
jgi:AcrR family transcriptional regulator